SGKAAVTKRFRKTTGRTLAARDSTGCITTLFGARIHLLQRWLDLPDPLADDSSARAGLVNRRHIRPGRSSGSTTDGRLGSRTKAPERRQTTPDRCNRER